MIKNNNELPLYRSHFPNVLTVETSLTECDCELAMG